MGEEVAEMAYLVQYSTLILFKVLLLYSSRVLYKPERGGIAISSHTYRDSSPAGLDPRVTQLLSKGSLPDVERQAILRKAKQHNHSSPISPLSPMDSVGISDSSCHSAGSYHQYIWF